MTSDFLKAEFDQPHPQRTRAILKAHPEVRALFGRNPATVAVMLLVVTLQTTLAFVFGRLGFHWWWLILLTAYCVGAFASHCSYVIIHDAIHNLILRNRSANKLVAIVADLVNLAPGAIGFGVYHLKHHAHQGDYEYDADM